MENTVLKYAAAALILMAGGCSAPEPGTETAWFDPSANHAITVHPYYATAQFIAPDPAAAMPPDEAARLGGFVADYLEHGRGTLAISVPEGPQSSTMVRYFGDQLTGLGISQARLRVSMHKRTDGDTVRLKYLTYRAQSDDCGDWSDNIDFTLLNTPMRNFGCATQHNLAAQADNPEDLLRPRRMTGSNGARRATVIGKYESGQDTASKGGKSNSVKISDVGENSGQ